MWEMKTIRTKNRLPEFDEEVKRALADGWEPFSVTVLQPNAFWEPASVLVLRRLVPRVFNDDYPDEEAKVWLQGTNSE